MSLGLFSLLILGISYLAGILGALTGLGGGVVIIPALVLLFKVNIHYAMGASLISVMATSSGSAVSYLRKGYTSVRIGMFLEVAAVVGAFVGALSVAYLPVQWIAVTFGSMLLLSSYLTWTRKESEKELNAPPHPWAVYLSLDGSYPVTGGFKNYKVHNVPLAFFIMLIAGSLSGLLGVGSGALKVLSMDQAMRLPYKVSTTTSNFMIGMTAAVSAGIYFANGYIDPGLTFPVLIGVLLGAITGSRALATMKVGLLRKIFSLAVFFLAIEMIYKGFNGSL